MRCIEPYHSKSVRNNHRGSELDNIGKKNNTSVYAVCRGATLQSLLQSLHNPSRQNMLQVNASFIDIWKQHYVEENIP